MSKEINVPLLLEAIKETKSEILGLATRLKRFSDLKSIDLGVKQWVLSEAQLMTALYGTLSMIVAEYNLQQLEEDDKQEEQPLG